MRLLFYSSLLTDTFCRCILRLIGINLSRSCFLPLQTALSHLLSLLGCLLVGLALWTRWFSCNWPKWIWTFRSLRLAEISSGPGPVSWELPTSPGCFFIALRTVLSLRHPLQLSQICSGRSTLMTRSGSFSLMKKIGSYCFPFRLLV